MKQSLQISIGQQLAITPQLQQAIKLLQLSALELRAEVQEVLDSNFMLEMDDGEETAGDGPDAAATVDAPADETQLNGEASAELDAPDPASPELSDVAARDEIPDELSVDSRWDDIYDGIGEPATGGASDDRDFEVQRGTETDLHDHLVEQLLLLRCSDTERLMGTAIIDAVRTDGYLGASLDDLAETLRAEGIEFEDGELLEMLRRIQQFDPAGVAARDLRECLLSQLGQLPPTTPWRSEAITLVSQHLNLLAARDQPQLRRVMGVENGTLMEIVQLIRSQSPRPGSAVEPFSAQTVVPEVIVRKANGAWTVELNTDAFPRLRINTQYSKLVRRNVQTEDNQALRTHLQEARWFLKSLRSRNDTLLRVSKCIVEEQEAFFEEGPEAMKPMVLADIAERVEMHESTISRVTSSKYMHTPRGTLELKYFFSSHVATDDGGQASATSVQAHIKSMVDAEDKSKPLSDAAIVKRLGESGIKVARRTVAKYRDRLGIGSSVERRMLT